MPSARHGSPTGSKGSPYVTPECPFVQMGIKRRAMPIIPRPEPSLDQAPHPLHPLRVGSGDRVDEILTMVDCEVSVSKCPKLVIRSPLITVNDTVGYSRRNYHRYQCLCVSRRHRLHHHSLRIGIDHTEHPKLWHAKLPANIVLCFKEMGFVDLDGPWTQRTLVQILIIQLFCSLGESIVPSHDCIIRGGNIARGSFQLLPLTPICENLRNSSQRELVL